MVNNTTVLALKELCVKVAGDGTTIDDIKGNTIPEVIEDITKRYTGASAESINQAVNEWLEKNPVDINEDKVNQIVEEKITQAVNSISNPFTTAYWKDSSDGNIYLVTMTNGVLSITKQEQEPDPIIPPENNLEGLLPDRLLIWNDEFDGTELDTTKWNYELGGRFRGSGSELQYYTDDPQNVYVENSILHLKAIKETYQGKDSTPYTWTSGDIQTNDKFEFGYGRIEARMKMQKETGSFPAFWLMGANYKYDYLTQEDDDKGTSMGYPWSNCGEIDIVELFGNQTYISSGLHFKDAIGSSDINVSIGNTTIDVTEWHTYALERTANNLELYVDNELKHTLAPSSSIARTIFNKPMFILLNQAIGGVAGEPSDDTTDMDLQVDWVRFYAPVDSESAEATGISLSANELALEYNVDDNVLLSVTFEPAWVNDMTLIWSSSDKNVVTCDGGYVKITGVGDCVITVSDKYGNSDTCNVVVSEQTRIKIVTEYKTTSDELEQYAKIDGETGDMGTTETSTVYSTPEFIDVTNSTNPKTIIVKASNAGMGGVYLYSYDKDYNFIGRKLVCQNSASEVQCTLSDDTAFIKFMFTGFGTAYMVKVTRYENLP